MTTLVNPPQLARPVGYSHAAVATGRVVALAGQIGWDQSSKLVSDDLALQFDRALENLCVALRAAGGQPEDLLSLRMYVVDKRDYNGKLKEIGASYRKHLGRHFPAMALVQVADLLEPGAKIEIEGLAVLPLAPDVEPPEPPTPTMGFPKKQPW